jgi:hypothetical protein
MDILPEVMGAITRASPDGAAFIAANLLYVHKSGGCIMQPADGRSLKLAAFVARNGPLDHFVPLRRTAPYL